RIFPQVRCLPMLAKSGIKQLVCRIPMRRALFVAFLIGWLFLTTVVPTLAPPGGPNPSGPG
ncbi:MAG: hypothetical protein ACXAB4_11195, partial [Candidatus Hodarchaeales archaeon]